MILALGAAGTSAYCSDLPRGHLADLGSVAPAYSAPRHTDKTDKSPLDPFCQFCQYQERRPVDVIDGGVRHPTASVSVTKTSRPRQFS